MDTSDHFRIIVNEINSHFQENPVTTCVNLNTEQWFLVYFTISILWAILQTANSVVIYMDNREQYKEVVTQFEIKYNLAKEHDKEVIAQLENKYKSIQQDTNTLRNQYSALIIENLNLKQINLQQHRQLSNYRQITKYRTPSWLN